MRRSLRARMRGKGGYEKDGVGSLRKTVVAGQPKKKGKMNVWVKRQEAAAGKKNKQREV